jgi:hypothetical protein
MFIKCTHFETKILELLDITNGNHIIYFNHIWFCVDSTENILLISILMDRGCRTIFKNQFGTIIAN